MMARYICGGKIFKGVDALKNAIDYSNRYFMEFNVVLGVELL